MSSGRCPSICLTLVERGSVLCRVHTVVAFEDEREQSSEKTIGLDITLDSKLSVKQTLEAAFRKTVNRLFPSNATGAPTSSMG
jgi:hypothetical protein